ncbi:hypothetical protein B0H14DRAFT_3607924 [Mycena olivaceomarginata]|nr:hypothetical protein B0H14DRAFT_3607924 [Mycena olivaceomarginata]
MSGSALDIKNRRALFSIVSSCLATVFACTWVSVHPNVPRPSQGNLALTWRRFCLMLVAIIAPELMAGFAARQFLDACWFSKNASAHFAMRNTTCPSRKAFSLLSAMGGFVSADDHPIATEKQLGPKYLAAIRNIRVEDIGQEQRRLVVEGRGTSSRTVVHHTVLGSCPAALSFVNIFIWLLWWHKPLDVQQPISLGLADEFMTWTEPRIDRRARAASYVLVGDCTFDPMRATSVPSFRSTHGFRGSQEAAGKGDVRFVSMFTSVQFLVGTVFGAIHYETLIWRSCSLVVVATPFGVALLFISAALGSKIFRAHSIHGKILGSLGDLVFYIIAVAYIGARLLLILLSVTTLRALPPDVFVDVNWSMYIPHL